MDIETFLTENLFSSPLGILLAGFLIGVWHARESDHLAAVAAIVAERKSVWSSAIIGGIWGLGHTISLFVAGLILVFLKIKFTEQGERILEFCVGVMLVFLGFNVLRKLFFSSEAHFHEHTHEGVTHLHPHDAAAHHYARFSPRALIVGMIHGLAGSAALMLVLLTQIESPALGLLYVVIFGVGSIGGMMLMSVIVGVPLSWTANRSRNWNLILQCLAGLVSVGVGFYVIYEKAIHESLIG